MRNWELEDEEELLRAEEIHRDANILIWLSGRISNQKLPFNWWNKK